MNAYVFDVRAPTGHKSITLPNISPLNICVFSGIDLSALLSSGNIVVYKLHNCLPIWNCLKADICRSIDMQPNSAGALNWLRLLALNMSKILIYHTSFGAKTAYHTSGVLDK